MKIFIKIINTFYLILVFPAGFYLMLSPMAFGHSVRTMDLLIVGVHAILVASLILSLVTFNKNTKNISFKVIFIIPIIILVLEIILIYFFGSI